MTDSTCELCNYTFYDKSTLKKHMNKRTPCVYECTNCSRKFKNKTSIKGHLIRCQMSIVDINTVCDGCDRAYSCRRSL